MSKQIKIQERREKAALATKRKKVKNDLVDYRVEGNDVMILAGPFVGKTLRQLWAAGSRERDYVVDKLWYTNDPEVTLIIRSLSC